MRPQALLPTEGTCEEIWMLKSFPLDLNREEGSCGWGEGAGGGDTKLVTRTSSGHKEGLPEAIPVSGLAV